MLANLISPRLLLVLTLSATVVGCKGGSECGDGVDNDSDGLIDDFDPGCAVNGDHESPEPPQCSDGVDNDADGIIDGADPGCTAADDDDEKNEPLAACKDGVDNDDDGLADFPNDPGCTLSLDDDETDTCPDGADCPACGNGVDDDADGITDYPDDPGCNNAGDADEFNADPSICGASVPLTLLPADGIATGTFDSMGTNNLISTDCGGTGAEMAFEFTLNETSALSITTDFPETTADTILYLRSMCRMPDTEVICNDDTTGTTSSMQIDSLPAGTYYLVVDSASSSGDFKVQVNGFSPEGGACDPGDPSPCPPGLVCRSASLGVDPTCEKPECSDGEDDLDPEDSAADYPDDPGCSSPDDNDESDDCDSGTPANCPQCSNGLDDDDDGFTDYGDDPGCSAAGDDLELECEAESDPVVAIDAGQMTGSTAGASNDLTASCATSTAPEVTYTLNVPGDLNWLDLDTVGSDFDTVLYIRQDDCASADLSCADEGAPEFGSSALSLTNVTAGIYLVMVDGYYSASGNFKLNVHGEIKAGETCDAAAETAGWMVCESGYACIASHCELAQCNNNLDDEPDGLKDFPNDPGCSSPSDNDEGDENCPGASCPKCSNGMDDDGDGLSDYGQDPGCTSAGDEDEIDECVSGLLIEDLESGMTSGTTPSLPAPSYTDGSCLADAEPEDVYLFRIDTANLADLTFTAASDSGVVLYIRQDDCGDSGSELGCEWTYNSTPQSITLDSPAAGNYYVFVEGYYASGVDYTLDYNGTLFVGAACGDPNLSCPAPQTCVGGTCQ